MWDSLSKSFDDGFDDLLDAGWDRVAKELAPEPASQTSSQPKTTPVVEDVGRNSDGTRVAQPVTSYPVAGQLLPGISNAKLALGGGAVLLLGGLWVMSRGRK